MKVQKGKPKGATGSVLEMYLGILNITKPKYCYPSQRHQLELLLKYPETDIARSTLNLWLNWLEENKWLKRYRGSYHRVHGGWKNKPSKVYLTRKALIWLTSIGKKVKSALWQVGKPQSFQGVRFSGLKSVTPNRVSSVLGVLPRIGLLLREKDGSVSHYNPITGELKAV